MKRSRPPGTLYVAAEEGGPSKIGVAVDPTKRVRIVAQVCTGPLRLVWSMPHPDCMRAETLVCRMLAKKKHKKYRAYGASEWFDVSPERVIQAAQEAIHILEVKDLAAMRKLKAPKHWKRAT
jgi:DNA topoisomerase VI subunit B